MWEQVQGRGSKNGEPRRGTHTWPEMNSAMLVMVDDDMKLEALPQTNYIKTIVSAELPMDLERKGQQSYQGSLNVRFLVFGNGTMKSLYDRSEGFFRRQIIITVRDKDKNREDDPFLAEKLCSEKEGIFLWHTKEL